MSKLKASNGEHPLSHKSGEKKTMSEKQPSGVFENISSYGSKMLNFDGAKKFAAWYIDTSEKVAKNALEFQKSTTAWAKETPLAPIFEAQQEFSKKLVERSTNAARTIWRLE
jgi:hypothetical protein